MATVDRVYRFEIDDQLVVAYESDGRRLWRCGCKGFNHTLSRGEEGRCAHIAVASWRAAMEGTIQFRKVHPVSENHVDRIGAIPEDAPHSDPDHTTQKSTV